METCPQGHPGITRMKALLKMYVWWPGINVDIEKLERVCHACLEVQASPPLTLTGPFQGKLILLQLTLTQNGLRHCVPLPHRHAALSKSYIPCSQNLGYQNYCGR